MYLLVHVIRKAAGTGTGPGVLGPLETAAAGAVDPEEGMYVLLDLASLGRLKLADNIVPGQTIQIQVLFREAGTTYCTRAHAAAADAALGTPSPLKLDPSCSLEPPPPAVSLHCMCSLTFGFSSSSHTMAVA